MKLYYDMLVPYMPDSIENEKGELVTDAYKIAGRNAMIALAKFQNGGNFTLLYQAVLHGCIYAKVDLVDTIMKVDLVPNIEESPFDETEELIDRAAQSLFKSIKSNYKFDIIEFAAYLLTAAHNISMRPSTSEEIEENIQHE